ncbi:hypothetical protein QBC47DRAFT_30572 [Echria macrotheca]|uniref:Mediator of RNA polymerase II transcription subunit 18 n=1 Tax=Echria macrotheca TaxID=438768 RepID=A0AAJ0FHW7_9PEZI|nr:hypothetical protein QBC47DRAFT_30572 [Echria macrotheca]
MVLYEVYLTAAVSDADAPKARALLGGVTEMSERHQFTKVRYLQREDPKPNSLDRFKELAKEKSPNASRWEQLHQILSKQSYILQERVNITNEVASANSGMPPPPLSANKPPLLKWNDWPDPQTQSYPAFITQRKTIEIADRRLNKILADSKFGTKSQSIEESYSWSLKNVEYTLTKFYYITTADPQHILDQTSWQPLAPMWILFVRLHSDHSPERMRQVQAQLKEVRERFFGIFDFRVFDRRAQDTRIMQPRP